jgi:penicillin-binding protein-related factor A (putative recombinase)
LDPDLTSIFYKKKIAFFTLVAAFVIPAFFFFFFCCSYNMYWFPNQNLCETKQKEEEEAALRRGWCSSISA